MAKKDIKRRHAAKEANACCAQRWKDQKTIGWEMYYPRSRGRPRVLRRSPKRRVEEIEIGDSGSASGKAQDMSQIMEEAEMTEQRNEDSIEKKMIIDYYGIEDPTS